MRGRCGNPWRLLSEEVLMMLANVQFIYKVSNIVFVLFEFAVS